MCSTEGRRPTRCPGSHSQAVVTENDRARLGGKHQEMTWRQMKSKAPNTLKRKSRRREAQDTAHGLWADSGLSIVQLDTVPTGSTPAHPRLSPFLQEASKPC